MDKFVFLSPKWKQKKKSLPPPLFLKICNKSRNYHIFPVLIHQSIINFIVILLEILWKYIFEGQGFGSVSRPFLSIFRVYFFSLFLSLTVKNSCWMFISEKDFYNIRCVHTDNSCPHPRKIKLKERVFVEF